MAINREISQFSNFVSVDDNTKKVSISTSFDIGGDSVISGDVTVGTATTGVVARTDGTLNVSGLSTFQGNVRLPDQVRLKFGGGSGGTSTSGDLQIYHTGAGSYIDDQGTGALVLKGTDIILEQGGDIAVRAQNNAAELYNNGSLKFETTGVGVSIVNGTSDTATIYGPSNLIIDPMPIGVGTTSGIVRIKGDLYVDGTTTEINSTTLTVDDLNIVVASGATNSLTADGAGLTVDGVNAHLKYNYNAGTNETWELNKNVGIGTDNATAKLDVNGTLNVTGVSTFHDNVNIADDERLRLGADSGGLHLYHNSNGGTSDIKQNASGSLRIRANQIVFYNKDITSTWLGCSFGAVSLYHNNDIKLITASDGIEVRGNATVGTATTGVVARDDGTLNVSGISTFSGDLNIDKSDPTIYLIDDTSDANNNNYEIANAGGYFWIRNTTDNKYLIRSTQNDNLQLYGNGTTVLETNSSGIDITGITTISQQLLINDFADTSSALGTKLYVNGPSVFQDDVRVGVGGTIGDLLVSGNIGIGSTQPTAKLDVDGTLNVSGISTFQDNIGISSGKSIQHIAEPQFNDNAHKAILSYGSTESTPAGTGGDFYREYAFHHNAGAGTTGTYYQRVNNNIDYEIGIDYDRKFAIGNHNQRPLHSDYTSFEVVQDGETKLYYNYNKKLETTGYGVSVYGGLNVSGIATFHDDVYVGDNERIYFGPSAGGYSSIHGSSVGLNIQSLASKHIKISSNSMGGTTGNVEITTGSSGGKVYLTGTGGVGIYHTDTAKKLETTGYGVSVTGGLNVSGVVTARSFVGSGELLTNIDAYAAYTSDRSTLATIADKISGIATYSEDQGFNYLGGNESYHSGSFFYGIDVEASDDGKVMFVSSVPFYTSANQSACGVQIYERTNSNFNYVGFVTSLSHHTLGAGQTVGDLGSFFGPTIASNADGSIFAVGSPNSVINTGSQYEFGVYSQYNAWDGTTHGYVNIFQKTGSNIEPLGILTAPPADIDNSSASMYGHAVALNADGTKLYVSAIGIETNTYGLLGNNTPQSGLVYAYNKVGTSYQQVGVITSHRANDFALPASSFGWDIACSDDGDTIYISGPTENIDGNYNGEGIVEVYSRTGNTFSHVGILTCGHDSTTDLIWQAAQFGINIDCSSDGNIVAIAAAPPYRSNQTPQGGGGALFVFEKTGTNTFTKIVEEVFDRHSITSNQSLELGEFDLAVNSDASTIIMSASKLTNAPSNEPGGRFVAFSRDGGNIRRIGNFTSLAQQPAGATYNYMMFGSSFDIDSTGDNVFVGAPIHPLGSTSNSLADKGSAYVFNITRQIALHSNQVTGNIGIGTDNPDASLSIYKPTTTTGVTTHLKVQDGSVYWAVEFEGNASNNTRIPYITSNKGLYFSSDGDFNFGNYAGTENYLQWGATAGQLDLLYGNSSQGHTNAIKLSTKSYGIDVSGDINVTGAASSITFDPSNNNGKTFFIRGEGNGNATIENDDEMYVSSTHLYIQKPGGTTTMAEFIEDGAVKLNHNNSTKLQTHDYGIDVTGRVETDTLNVSGIATAQKFVGDGSELTNLPPAGSDLVSYASASDISNSALSISGISTYNEVGILTGSHATLADTFGYSVATSADGKTIIVGAYDDEIPGALLNSGVVYVYDREGNNFNEVGILTGSYATNNNDAFGYSVATSADGKTIVVGARSDETSGSDGYGLVYVFDREGNNFNEVGILTGSYASDSGDLFGNSVATSADGKTIVVGAHRDETGATNDTGVVYVFDREGNNFNEVGILTGSYATTTNDNFGWSVATSADGKTIVVGAYRDETGATNDTGVVYVFDREGNNFNEVGILTGSYSQDLFDYFGYSVATSADGKTIVVGALRDEVSPSGIGTYGVVYVYDREGNNFNEVGILSGSYATNNNDSFGVSVATSADGKTIIVGATSDETSGSGDYGVVYVFNRQGNNFNEVGILTGTYASDSDDRFGDVVATSADGKTIIVGAYKDEIGAVDRTGVVYVYDQERETYVFSDTNGNIGIGSAQPTAKLDVNGTLNVSGISTFASSVSVGAGSSVSIGGTTLGPVDSGIGQMGSIQLNGDGAYQYFAGYNINGRAAFIQKTDPVSNGGNGWHYHGLYNTENQQWSLLHFDGSNVGAAFTSTFIYGGGDHAPVYVYPNYVRLNHIDGSTVNTRLETTGYGVTVSGGLNVSGISTLGTVKISSGIITATSGIVTYYGDGSQLSGITSLEDSNGVIRAQANTDGTISIGTHSIVSITTSHTSVAGISSTIDTFATSANDLAEYTIYVENGSNIQAQKVLVMQDGTTAYSQEYAVMYNPSKIVTIESSISGSNVLLQATPETGISGITTYKIVRGGLV